MAEHAKEHESKSIRGLLVNLCCSLHNPWSTAPTQGVDKFFKSYCTSLVQFTQGQIQIKLLVGQCCEEQNNSTLQTQQEFRAIKQHHAMGVLFSTSDNTPHHNPKIKKA